jgi:hypothetical protein
MEAMMMIALGLAGINVVVLSVLLFIYSKIVLRTKAVYAAGLLVFALLLIGQNLLTIFAYALMAPFFNAETLPYLAGMAGFELAGLLVLTKITI